MGLAGYLQHWLGGKGPRIRVRDFVPPDHYLRLWADTFPWTKMVDAIEASIARRFPKEVTQGRFPVSSRVLLGLELLKAELSSSDEQICSRLRTDFAVMYVCGIEHVQADCEQGHFVLPEVLSQFRSRLDEALLEELLQIQATAAMEQGLVSPEHVVVDTFASEQGSQRVTDATTLYKAKKKSSPSSGTSPTSSRKRR
jgi:transposase